MKNSNDTIGNLTRDLLACKAEYVHIYPLVLKQCLIVIFYLSLSFLSLSLSHVTNQVHKTEFTEPCFVVTEDGKVSVSRAFHFLEQLISLRGKSSRL